MVKNEIKLLLTEDLSPYKLSLLILIQLYLNNKLPVPQLILLTQLIEKKQVLAIPGASPGVIIHSLKDLCDIIKDEKTERILLDVVWNVRSVEDLENDHINQLMKCVKLGIITVNSSSPEATKIVSSKSLFGSFVLKICTAFATLKFDESQLLFQAFSEFRESTRQIYINQGGIISDSISDPDFELFNHLNNNLKEIGVINTTSKIIPVPRYDLQQLLDNQITLLESYGTPTPQYLKDIMLLMTSPNSNVGRIQNINFNNLPSYHYLRYLECLQESDYNGAFDALHQYFDYMVSNNSKYFYHFALISRAALHQYFGEDDKAIDAIEEAISVARENKDNSTLTYILSWLFNFMKNKPELWNRQTFYNNNNETQVLDFLIKKSKQVSPLLYSMSYNFETLQIMHNGGKSYMNSLIKSMFIAINDARPTFIKAAELAATVWSRIGEPALSEVYSMIAMELTDKATDKVSLSIRMSFLKFLSGDVDLAYNKLENLKKEVTDHSMYNSIHKRSLMMSIRLNLQKGRYNICKNIINVLLDNAFKDTELRNELLMLQVEVEMCLENYSHALCLLSKIQLNDVYLAIRVALLKCNIFIRSGNHYRVFSLLTQQIQLSKRCGFGYIYTEAVLLFWEVLNSVGALSDALKLSEEVMPHVQRLNNRELISRAYYELARSYKDQSTALLYTQLAISGFEKCSNFILLEKSLKLQINLAVIHNEPEIAQKTNNVLAIVQQKLQKETRKGYI